MQTTAFDAEAILVLDNQSIEARPLPNKHMLLRYRDGGEYELDFNPIIAEGGAAAALVNPVVFAGACISYGGIALAFPGELDSMPQAYASMQSCSYTV